jgi:hypothetical protein
LSDQICLEHGLSIIENPKRSGKSYDKWLGDKKPLSHQEKLCHAIDVVLLERPADFEAFLLKMEAAGYEIKRGKYPAFRAPGENKFTRLRSLGKEYSEQEIWEAIEGKKPLPSSRSVQAQSTPQKVSLLGLV